MGCGVSNLTSIARMPSKLTASCRALVSANALQRDHTVRAVLKKLPDETLRTICRDLGVDCGGDRQELSACILERAAYL